MNDQLLLLQQRYAGLQGLSAHLRTTHVGIDSAIDRVLDAVRPWCLFSEAQGRPRVVGLWGMTGTGKSSLVHAMTQHLGIEDRTFWLDAGELQRSNTFDGVLDRIRAHHDGGPFVLVVDEFQHARTVRSGTEREETPELRRLWEFIDSGRAMVAPTYGHRLRSVVDLREEVRALVNQGVVVCGGKVTRGLGIYRKVMASHYSVKPRSIPWAIPECSWDEVRELFPEPISLMDVQRLIEKLDGQGLLQLLDELIAKAIAPAPLDGSKALILVLGNLDELYSSGRDPIPEMDPEVLLSRHRSLNTTGIQLALLNMFRIEQVARLGSDHIVFPPMGRTAVNSLLENHAARVTERLAHLTGSPLEVTSALLARIQREATVAVLGARPLVAAVDRVLPALYAQVLAQTDASLPEPCTLDVVDGKVVARLGEHGHCVIVPLEWPLPMREAQDRDELRRNAVHEAGHLVCGRLTGRKALQACARTSNERIGGFVIWDRPVNTMIRRSEVVPHLAAKLGGWAAEVVVFGNDGVSAGCQDDLQKASSFALELVKEHGFGTDRLFHAEHAQAPIPGFRTRLSGAEEQAREWIEAAESLALDTVKANRQVLTSLSNALVEKGSLGPREIELCFAADTQLVIENFA